MRNWLAERSFVIAKEDIVIHDIMYHITFLLLAVLSREIGKSFHYFTFFILFSLALRTIFKPSFIIRVCIFCQIANCGVKNWLPWTLDTWIGFPFKNAPRPFLAVNSCSRMGLYTIPRTTCFLTAKPMTTHVCGNPWTKLVVPSMGSMIHVGTSVNSGSSLPVDSSAINLIINER